MRATNTERLEALVLLGAAALLLRDATFTNASYRKAADDFLKEYERFRDS